VLADHRTTQERDAERISRQQRFQALIKQVAPREPRVRVIDGVEYQIQFDGT
jgi:hypothetical protein